MTGLYFIGCGSFIKIGYSSDIGSRVYDLQRSNPHRLEVLGVVPLTSVKALQLERILHRHFAQQRYRFEWFHESEELFDYIEEHASPLKVESGDEACDHGRFGDPSEALRPCKASCPLAGLRPEAHHPNDSQRSTEGVSRRARVAYSD